MLHVRQDSNHAVRVTYGPFAWLALWRLHRMLEWTPSPAQCRADSLDHPYTYHIAACDARQASRVAVPTSNGEPQRSPCVGVPGP